MNDAPRHPSFAGVVVALAIAQLLVWAALYYGFSSFVLPMRDDLRWSEATLMGAFSVGLAAWAGGSYAVGAAIDRGRGRAVLAGGTVLGGIGLCAWALVREPWQLYAAWLLLGVAMAMLLYDPAFIVLTKRYPQRYRHGITALTLVAGFASTLSFPAVAWLMPALGWRGTLLAMAAVMLVVVLPLHLWAVRGDDAGGAAAARQPDERDNTLRQALHQSTFWLLTLAFTLYFFTNGALWAHMMPALASKGLSQGEALSVVVWVGPAQVAGRLLFAALGRAWSMRLLGAVVLTGLPIALVLFALARSPWVLWLFAALFGAVNGLITIVRGGLIPEVFGRAQVGRISGAMTGIGLLARAGAPVSTAALLLALGGYRELLLLLGAFGVVAVLSFWRGIAARR
ncbi:MAG TPA: MFS transporter [Burkholderiaceae bacterium]|nr:MFS transporter [Burkholderiaceae bacterium]